MGSTMSMLCMSDTVRRHGTSRSKTEHLSAHSLAGPYVRLGPHVVGVSDVKAVREVHSIPTKYPKTEYYTDIGGRNPPNVFTMLDIVSRSGTFSLPGEVFECLTPAQTESPCAPSSPPGEPTFGNITPRTGVSD